MRRFFRGVVIFLIGGIVGTAFGVALGFFLFPYVFPPPPAAEQLTAADVASPAPPPPQAAAPAPTPTPDALPATTVAPPSPIPPSQPAPVAVATGTFIHANPSDPVHWGRGRVSVYEKVVFLEPDFEVGPGPKYHVYLVPKANIRNENGVKGTMFIDLGRLRAFKGSQRYPIPAGVDLKNYPSVVIWCEAFGVLITPADLQPVAR